MRRDGRISTITALIVLALAPLVSTAAQVKITVTNNQEAGGVSLTPVWLGIHDGTFVTFTPGATTGPDWEALAELGDTGPITAAFAGQGAQTTLFGPGPFLPGTTNSTTLDVADPSTLRYLSFGTMVVPSNDLFLGNGDPTAITLFDAGGNFLGPQTITLFGRNVWDAGTEVNDITDHPAFVAGVSAVGGTDENGVAGLFFDRADAASYVSSLIGIDTAAGYTITNGFNPSSRLLTISITAVPEPSTITLGLAGLGLGLVVSRVKRSRRSRAES